jgi:DNA-binding CsgD family transcriptional regulator
VRAVRFLSSAARPRKYIGRPLSELLEAVGAPSASEALRPVIERGSREAWAVAVPDGDVPLRVLSASVLDEKAALVVIRGVDPRVLGDMLEAKVARVSAKRRLSVRERQVLQQLVRGRGVQEIGTLLGIAPRTVKFHQANVLQKLGADSRADLLRVLL